MHPCAQLLCLLLLLRWLVLVVADLRDEGGLPLARSLEHRGHLLVGLTRRVGHGRGERGLVLGRPLPRLCLQLPHAVLRRTQIGRHRLRLLLRLILGDRKRRVVLGVHLRHLRLQLLDGVPVRVPLLRLGLELLDARARLKERPLLFRLVDGDGHRSLVLRGQALQLLGVPRLQLAHRLRHCALDVAPAPALARPVLNSSVLLLEDRVLRLQSLEALDHLDQLLLQLLHLILLLRQPRVQRGPVVAHGGREGDGEGDNEAQ